MSKDLAAVPEETAPRRNFYGRRQGRPLRDSRKRLIETLLPQITVGIEPGKVIDPAALFAAEIKQHWLEIGFGGGEHLAAQAAAHRDVGLIGCDIFLNSRMFGSILKTCVICCRR
jgi:tRNA (guanine-N7-)-methyltransferase